MTESNGVIAVQPLRDKAAYGIVGAPFPSCEIKLVEFNDYNPNPTNGSRPQGEVWVRGGNVMSGYYKQPRLTKETLTEDGWLMTGDIGEWREDGSLAIIDRKKNLVKLSHGEYVALEKLEAQYKTSRLVLNMCIHADPLQSYIVGIVVPNEVEVSKVVKSVGANPGDYNNPRVLDALVKDFAECAKSAGFKGAELLKAIVLVTEEWTPESGMLTAAQKLNRKYILKHYAEEVADLYRKK
jgi:long-chain acyl-CoA synthetase